jgi:hydroxylamine reductase (hybrid-cluster protein)
LLLFLLGSFGLSGSLFYSKIMFKYDHLNAMESVYVCSLVLFSITMFLFLTYINNWFSTYRHKTNSAIQNFKFPENASSISESYTKQRMEELQQLNKSDDSPKSLRYNEPSVSESDTLSEVEEQKVKKEPTTPPPVIENDHIMNYLRV